MGNGFLTRVWGWFKVPLIGGADTLDLFLVVIVLTCASLFWTRVLRDVGVE
jgi:hypothetical protein